MTRPRLCVFHKRMASTIASVVQDAGLAIDIDVVEDITRDPPHADNIDWLVCNAFPLGLLGRLPRLAWVQLTGVGTNHVAAGSARPGVVVSHAGDVHSTAVAEFALFGVMWFAKAGPSLLTAQAARRWELPDIRLLRSATLLIVGFGRIGSEVAIRAKSFGMRVIGVRRSATPSPLADEMHGPSDLMSIAARADFVVIAVGAENNERLIDRRFVDALRQDAVIVNVARGSVVDSDAIAEALRAGRIRGALLDVFDEEPLPSSHPLWSTPQLLPTPHCAFHRPAEAEDLGALVVENIRRMLSGETPRNLAFKT